MITNTKIVLIGAAQKCKEQSNGIFKAKQIAKTVDYF